MKTMRFVTTGLATLLASCGSAVPQEADVSEMGISVDSAGLSELRTKVLSRDDAECFEASFAATACFVSGRTQLYRFTEEGHPAHPAACFRGYEGEGRERRLEERGWFAGDARAASTFFDLCSDGIIQPQRRPERQR